MRDNVKNTIGLLLLLLGFLLAVFAGISVFRDMAMMDHSYTLCKILLGAALFSFAAGLLLLANSGNSFGKS